ncbi:MAG: protein-L-isoaspartate(D-aspartate) O-methyltransferase [Terrimicrobiaceae bacterium]|nr:protein-L-isoaspartate(D-aspartate) O-methyltransferase [Terrimicrobiaceae bacterium]
MPWSFRPSRARGLTRWLPAISAAALPAAGVAEEEAPRQAEREAMVARQISARGVSHPGVLGAMRKIPRHEFVPESVRREAYEDTPLPIGHGQTISQPYIVALMTELLDPKPGDKVLEVGTGSGYQAAVLSPLAGKVFTIEIVEPLARRARETLERLGFRNVEVRAGDGYAGWPEAAPFDSIIVTCAPEAIPQPLIDQLREGGRMVIPVGPEGGVQELVLAIKQDGQIRKERVLPVRFVPMTGAAREGRD